jgi:peptide/nickel transport system permease protein
MLFNRKKQIEASIASMTEDDYVARTLWQEIKIRFVRNKSAMGGMYVILALLAVSIITMIIDFATNKSIYNALVVQQNLANKLLPPCSSHILGCDEYGRDILVRMLWGTRYSLFLGVSSILFATIIGGLLGAIAGYWGGILDNVFMRIMDVLLAIPYMLLAIAIVSALGSSLTNLALSIGIPEIPGFARIMRASVMTVKDRDFVEAARASGASGRRILFRYIIPNCLAPLIVQFSLSVANAILNIAGLSYIGLGIQPPTPEWGAMLNGARNYIRDAWHITVIPGLGIMTAVLSLNLFGDGVRDAFDPHMKR